MQLSTQICDLSNSHRKFQLGLTLSACICVSEVLFVFPSPDMITETKIPRHAAIFVLRDPIHFPQRLRPPDAPSSPAAPSRLPSSPVRWNMLKFRIAMGNGWDGDGSDNKILPSSNKERLPLENLLLKQAIMRWGLNISATQPESADVMGWEWVREPFEIWRRYLNDLSSMWQSQADWMCEMQWSDYDGYV